MLGGGFKGCTEARFWILGAKSRFVVCKLHGCLVLDLLQLWAEGRDEDDLLVGDETQGVDLCHQDVGRYHVELEKAIS